MRPVLLLAALAALAVLPYIPVFSQPYVADDYQQIDISRSWGPVSGWPALAAEPLYRSRATSILFTHWTELLFGDSPLIFYSSAVLLHVLNVWMLFALGFWKRIGWTLSFATAAFFAIYLGHQEAVMWYAAVHELLMFFFAIAFLIFWIRWTQPSGSWAIYAASALCFLLTIYSKEPGVALVPLAALLTCWEAGDRRTRLFKLASLIPFAVVAVVYTLEILAAGKIHQHLNDGTFSIHAKFWITWRNSFGRLLWIWGLLSLIWLGATGEWRRYRPLLLAAGIWISLTLLPFSFLTYMPRIPSRHTYLPSAGLALLVGIGLVSFRDRVGRAHRFAMPAVATVLIAHHCLYLWLIKRPQFLARAEATETVVRLVREGHVPLHIRCFPYPEMIADLAVSMTLQKDPKSLLVWENGAQQAICPVGVFSYPPATPPDPAALR